jgi:hypothetical protein
MQVFGFPLKRLSQSVAKKPLQGHFIELKQDSLSEIQSLKVHVFCHVLCKLQAASRIKRRQISGPRRTEALNGSWTALEQSLAPCKLRVPHSPLQR